MINKTDEDEIMMQQVKNSFQRTQSTFLADAAGVAALAIMLVVALHMPGLV